MNLWHADWKPLPDGRWLIAYLDASRLAEDYGVFEEATTENAISVLEQTIARYRCPKDPD